MSERREDQRRAAHGALDEAAADLVQVIDGSVAQLWETIESLERLQPRNLERFRVSIFGSARIAESHPLFAESASSSRSALPRPAATSSPVGGGGLMQAVDQGASRGAVNQPADGDLPVRLVTDGEGCTLCGAVYRHRTFFSRLHHFVRLSSAFIVLPGGIGSTLEAMMVWQLLQAKHLPPTPFLLYGSSLARAASLDRGRGPRPGISRGGGHPPADPGRHGRRGCGDHPSDPARVPGAIGGSLA